MRKQLYHANRHIRFYSLLGKNEGQVKRGRPLQLTAQTAFDRMCEHMEMNYDHDLFTLEDLHSLRIKLSPTGDASDVYSIKHK
jgi:hypothetical protein